MMGLENWVAFRLCLLNSSSLPKYKSHRAANIHPKSNFTLNESLSKMAKNWQLCTVLAASACKN
jgi:hypothetical protein